MTSAINIIVALILTGLAVKYATGSSKDPITRGRYFLLFVLATGMFQTGGFTVGGLNLSAIRLMVWIVLASYIILCLPKVKGIIPIPVVLYGLFLLWCGMEWFRAPSLMYGLRAFLKLFYPFLILVIAWRCSRRGELAKTLGIICTATLIISAFSSGISEKIPYLVYNPVTRALLWPRSTFADHAAIMVGAFLCLYWLRPEKLRFVGFALTWLVLSPLVISNRTGLLATCAAISGYSFSRYRSKALPIIAGLLVAGASVFVFSDEFRESTFGKKKDMSISTIHSVDLGTINSSGRFYFWKRLMKKFYAENPVMGGGLGSVQEYMYTNPHYFGGLQVPHSDYVMLLCDTGLVGLGVYLAFAFLCMYRGLRLAWSASDCELRVSGALVFASWLACLCAMGFDNVFNYSLAAHSLPFAFTGMMEGIRCNAPISNDFLNITSIDYQPLVNSNQVKN